MRRWRKPQNRTGGSEVDRRKWVGWMRNYNAEVEVQKKLKTPQKKQTERSGWGGYAEVEVQKTPK